jgi:hypothetical protein
MEVIVAVLLMDIYLKLDLTDWNGLEWRKLVLDCLEWFGIEEVGLAAENGLRRNPPSLV